MLHVALYQPEIPPNTGNIARQCVGLNACLHIIGPVNFDLSDSAVKRAGLDHWKELDLTIHENPDTFLNWLGNRRPWLASKYGKLRYDVPGYEDEDVLIFGSETSGLPDSWLAKWPDRTVIVPILGRVRSYNLSNTVAILLAQASLNAGMYDRSEARKLGRSDV